MIENKQVISLVEVEMSWKIMKAMSYFKYLESCSSKDEGLKENVKVRVDEGLKILNATKMMLMSGS